MEDELREISRSILERGSFISLATVDEGGVWVSGLLYCLDSEYNIYWHSDESVRHSQAIQKNPHVAGTVIISQKPGDPSEAVQISGVAEKVDQMPDIALQHYAQKSAHKEEIPSTSPNGSSWYRIIPQKVRLSYSQKFGYEKKDTSF